MKTKPLVILDFIFGVFILVSCRATNTPQSVLVLTVTPPLAATISPTKTFLPRTPMPQLLPIATNNGLPVFEINQFTVDHEYCQPPEVFLSHADAQGVSDDGIAQKLMELWLDYFNTSKAPDYCRIDGYTIDKVHYDERTPSLPLEPKGDIMRVIQYSIKLIQYPNFWMSWAGEIDKENWLHTENTVAVFRTSTGYTMEFANP